MQAMSPMPILIALQRAPDLLQVPPNATVFEINPWEIGSYDRGAAAFAPLKYVGSNFIGGIVPQDSQCIAGMDNAGFVMGTSSSVFNQAFSQISLVDTLPKFLIELLNKSLADVGEADQDIASWPNPFYRFDSNNNNNAETQLLTLVDGAEALENIPLYPLTLRDRHIDVIFAIDNSADTQTSWPNGTALVATYHRSLMGTGTNNTALPPVPDQNTFVNLGLNMRPTFFGCSNSSTSLIVYLPNSPYTAFSNHSNFILSYTNNQRDQFILNGYNVATMGNGTVDKKWPVCVGCAVLARSLERTGTTVPAACVDCFNRYCWNGTTNSTLPPIFDPQQIIASSDGPRPIMWKTSIALISYMLGLWFSLNPNFDIL
jgi:lysophospholipase